MSGLDASLRDDAHHPNRSSGVFGPWTFMVLVACLAAAGVSALADSAREHDGLSRRDPTVAGAVLRLRTPALTHLAHALTFLGSEIVVGGLAIAVLLTLVTRRDFTRAATFVLGMGGSAFLTVAVKILVARPRPGAVDRLGAVDTTYSFPSGHTLNSTVFLALVVWLLWPSVKYAGHIALVTTAALVAVGVAASRVYLGYHWLTDVMASGLVALAWLCIVWALSATVMRSPPRLRWPDRRRRSISRRDSPLRPLPR